MSPVIKPKLNVFDTTMIVVSLVIGICIFRTPAMVASATGRPFLFFTAWTLGGFISLLGALTFAEIGSRFPKPGAYYKVVAECYHSSLAFMLNLAIVASTIFFLRKRAGAEDYQGFRVPFYPILPAVFVIFLFAISMNVLATQTRSALFGVVIMASGLPVFLLMRKLHKKGARP
jgi:amino acid transporter